MKVQLETITSQDNRSFSLMVNPRLSDLFFWHFHPEYEIVFIEGATGTRHVGEHISAYHGSDLVLIGSNIPHLNFDFGVTTDYQKVVVHLNKAFVEAHYANTPELGAIHRLFQRSAMGLAFGGPAKANIGAQLFDMAGQEPFDQYLRLTSILNQLAAVEEVEPLHDKPYQHTFSNREQERLQQVYAFVDKNFHRKIELDEIAKVCFMTREAFCRYFKKMTKYTFIQFLNRYRISHSKRYLMKGKSVSDACFLSGFESLSYYNRVFKQITNENPSKFRKRYL